LKHIEAQLNRQAQEPVAGCAYYYASISDVVFIESIDEVRESAETTVGVLLANRSFVVLFKQKFLN
jgi:hypothetical protein